MSLWIPSFACAAVNPLRKEHRARPRLNIIRAQGLPNEGRSSNNVDSNMKILKDRLAIMRTKERLEMNCRSYGWDCPTDKHEKQPEYPQTPSITLSSLSVLMLLYAFSVVIAHLNL